MLSNNTTLYHAAPRRFTDTRQTTTNNCDWQPCWQRK